MPPVDLVRMLHGLIAVAFWTMLPAYIPNNAAVLAGGGAPIDGGRTGARRRLLGGGDTWGRAAVRPAGGGAHPPVPRLTVPPGARLGVVVVASDLALDMMDELDGRVQSVFRPEEVFFPKYDREEAFDILRDRVERGFHEGVLDRAELEHVAERTAQSGDLRVGIDLLHRAGLNAERRASKTVSREDVDAAYEQSKHVHLSRRLRELSDSERALVAVVLEHDDEEG